MKLVELLDRRQVGLTILRFALFECEYCGNIVEKQLSNGKRDKSCGCHKNKLITESNTKHGDSIKSSEYNDLFGIWAKMRDRCSRETNQDYCYYGAKGIIVESEWDDYIEFKRWSLLNGYEPKKNLQIDRENGNKNYCSSNCRWVTPKVNQRNRKCVILSEEKAEEIRKLIAKNLKNKEIAKMYSVHEDTINDIRKGKTWN